MLLFSPLSASSPCSLARLSRQPLQSSEHPPQGRGGGCRRAERAPLRGRGAAAEEAPPELGQSVLLPGGVGRGLLGEQQVEGGRS